MSAIKKIKNTVKHHQSAIAVIKRMMHTRKNWVRNAIDATRKPVGTKLNSTTAKPNSRFGASTKTPAVTVATLTIDIKMSPRHVTPVMPLMIPIKAAMVANAKPVTMKRTGQNHTLITIKKQNLKYAVNIKMLLAIAATPIKPAPFLKSALKKPVLPAIKMMILIMDKMAINARNAIQKFAGANTNLIMTKTLNLSLEDCIRNSHAQPATRVIKTKK